MASKKIVFITGGNAGIGYEAVKAMLQSDQKYLVLMGSRSLERANTAIGSLKKEVPQTSPAVSSRFRSIFRATSRLGRHSRLSRRATTISTRSSITQVSQESSPYPSLDECHYLSWYISRYLGACLSS